MSTFNRQLVGGAALPVMIVTSSWFNLCPPCDGVTIVAGNLTVDGWSLGMTSVTAVGAMVEAEVVDARGTDKALREGK